MITAKNIRYFKKAKQVSLESDIKKAKVGCIVVYKNHIISSSSNSSKSHPQQKYYDSNYRKICDDDGYTTKLHAEIASLNAIRHLDIDFSQIDLYIYRSCKCRDFGMARPCKGCFAAIKDLGIRNIYYTTDTGYAYERVIA